MLKTIIATLLAASALGAAAQEPSAYRVSIVNPADQSTVLGGMGEMTIRTSVSPPLAKGDRLELLVDGQSAGPPSTSLALALSGMARGLHLVQARVIDATGNVAAASPADTFYVLDEATP